mgnify:FL=1
MKRRLISTIVLVFCILFFSSMVAQTTKWRDMYKVKKKDTLYGIANKYGISLPDLMEANPDMKQEGYQLKKGIFVFIPYGSVNSAEGMNITKGQMQSAVIHVGVMLPLHDNDGDGKRMTEYYRGILMACDQLKQQGYAIDVKAWNVPAGADIRNTLLEKGASQCNMIFGPLYTSQVSSLAGFCQTYGIKMIIPFSIESTAVNDNSQIFQVYQPSYVFNASAVHAFITRFKSYHTVFIDCNDPASAKGEYTIVLRKTIDNKGIGYSVTSLNSNDDQFAKAFDKVKPNIIVLNAASSPKLNMAFDKLNILKRKYPDMNISMMGYTEWLMYEKYDIDNFHKYDVYIPSNYYFNSSSPAFVALDSAYKAWFHTNMMDAIPRFAVTGYDHAEYFLRGYHSYGEKFVGSLAQSKYSAIQVPLHFARIPNGGLLNQNFQLIHYLPNGTGIESIAY